MQTLQIFFFKSTLILDAFTSVGEKLALFLLVFPLTYGDSNGGLEENMDKSSQLAST